MHLRTPLPLLKQQLPLRPRLLQEAISAGENAFTTQPRLAHDTPEFLIFIRRDLVAEQHGAGFDLGIHIDVSEIFFPPRMK